MAPVRFTPTGAEVGGDMCNIVLGRCTRAREGDGKFGLLRRLHARSLQHIWLPSLIAGIFRSAAHIGQVLLRNRGQLTCPFRV